MMDVNYLGNIIAQFAYYKLLGVQTFEQLKQEDLIWQYNAENNSIAIIVQHVSGNMSSRWTHFLEMKKALLKYATPLILFNI
ncbi:MAG: DUF1572 family protein [Saprospiraceae bacterium]|nr:DUF1572 family protein [Saprospiraceae bacterium]